MNEEFERSFISLSGKSENLDQPNEEKIDELLLLSQKSLQELKKVEDEFNHFQRILEIGKKIQREPTVAGLFSGEPLMEETYLEITKRIQGGESIEKIIKEAEEKRKKLYPILLEKKIKFLKKRADFLKREVGSPVTPWDIESFFFSYQEDFHSLQEERFTTFERDYFVFWEIKKRIQEGESIEDIQKKARMEIEEIDRLQLILSFAERIEKGEEFDKENPIIKEIKHRLTQGEALDKIIQDTKRKIQAHFDAIKKKHELAYILREIEKVKKKIIEFKKNHEIETETEERKKISLSPEKIENFNFKKYILQGGELIKRGEYYQAIEHFSNEEELKKVGAFLNKGFFRVSSPEEVRELIYDRTFRDYFFTFKTGEIRLGRVVIEGQEDKITYQQNFLPKELAHELALVYMEEWLHWLQYISEETVGGHLDSEQDVAFYMKKHGIPMTESFKKRYDRFKALDYYFPSDKG